MYEKTIVCYYVGRLSTDVDLPFGFDEIEELADKIVDDWCNQVDIRNFEEEGYIGAYAERVIKGMFT